VAAGYSGAKNTTGPPLPLWEIPIGFHSDPGGGPI